MLFSSRLFFYKVWENIFNDGSKFLGGTEFIWNTWPSTKSCFWAFPESTGAAANTTYTTVFRHFEILFFFSLSNTDNYFLNFILQLVLRKINIQMFPNLSKCREILFARYGGVACLYWNSVFEIERPSVGINTTLIATNQNFHLFLYYYYLN